MMTMTTIAARASRSRCQTPRSPLHFLRIQRHLRGDGYEQLMIEIELIAQFALEKLEK